jgi:glycosyltransferase involved in cell wall biosynthesis
MLNNSLNPKIPFAKFCLKLWPKPLGILSYTLKSLILSRKLRKQIDIVHVHTAGYPMMIAGFLFSLFNHKPYIVACRGSDIRISSRKFLYRAFQLPFLRNAKTLVAVSNEIAELLTNKYGISQPKILVIRNAYNDRVIQEIADIKVQDENLRSKRIVCVASMRPEKDHITLLKGFKAITKSIDGAQLLLIGDGPLRKQLEEFCAKQRLRNVRFLGKVPFNEVLENVAKSDIFILTSIEEAMPNAVIEALALGKPVIATMVGGIPEIVKDRFNGLLIPPKSPKHVAKALHKLLSDERLYSKLSSNTTKSVHDHSWSETILRYEQMYTDLLNQS